MVDDLSMQLPPLTLRPGMRNTPQKPVVLLMSTGGVSEFGNLETAQHYLDNALRIGAPGATEAALFNYDFECKEWKRIR